MQEKREYGDPSGYLAWFSQGGKMVSFPLGPKGWSMSMGPTFKDTLISSGFYQIAYRSDIDGLSIVGIPCELDGYPVTGVIEVGFDEAANLCVLNRRRITCAETLPSELIMAKIVVLDPELVLEPVAIVVDPASKSRMAELSSCAWLSAFSQVRDGLEVLAARTALQWSRAGERPVLKHYGDLFPKTSPHAKQPTKFAGVPEFLAWFGQQETTVRLDSETLGIPEWEILIGPNGPDTKFVHSSGLTIESSGQYGAWKMCRPLFKIGNQLASYTVRFCSNGKGLDTDIQELSQDLELPEGQIVISAGAVQPDRTEIPVAVVAKSTDKDVYAGLSDDDWLEAFLYAGEGPELTAVRSLYNWARVA